MLTIIFKKIERERHERRRQREVESEIDREKGRGKIVRQTKREKQKYR